MSNDFEKRVSQHIDGFQLSPGPQVWERVAAALPEKRRHRFAIWWLLPLAACLCGGIWLIIDQQKDTNNKRITDVARSTAEDGSQKKIIKPASVDTVENEIVQQNKKPRDLLTKKENSVQHTADVNNKEVVANHHSKKSKQPRQPLQAGNLMVTPGVERSIQENVVLDRHSQTPSKQTEEVDYILNHAVGNAAVQKALNSDSNFLLKEPILQLVEVTLTPLPEIVAKKDTTLLKNSDTLLRTSVTIKTLEAKSKNKKSEWSLILAIGKSSLNDGNSDIAKSIAYANPLNSGGLTSGGQAGSTGTFSNPTGGFSFSAGIIRSQTISKHFSWQAELNYQLLTAKQRIGNRNDSLEKADASTDVAFYPANRIGNTTGQAASTFSSNSSNKVHRLQIASGIRYTFNSQANSPVSLFAGISVAYNISNNLLLHDYRSYSYIRSSSLSNQLILGSQVGFDVFIKHKIHGGLIYQHDFTNVAKAKVGSVFRWNQLQLRIAIPFSKH